MNKQKGISSLSWIVIVLSVVIVAGGITTWQMWPKQEAPTPSSSPASTPTSALSTSDTTTIDETADWKTYNNPPYGIQFKYPPTYEIDEQDEIAPGKGEQMLILEDKSREGNPTIRIIFNIDGVGGLCMNDVQYETDLKNGKVGIVSRDAYDILDCMGQLSITESELNNWIEEEYKNKIIWVSIGKYPTWSYDEENQSKNSILITLTFEREILDYEDELLKIIETMNFEKEELFGHKPVD